MAMWPLQATIGQDERFKVFRHALYFQETARENRNKDALGWSGQRGEGEHV